MAVRAEELDRWEDEVVPESVAHSDLAALVAMAARISLPPDRRLVERLGIIWPEGDRSSPDVGVFRADEVDRSTRSHRVGEHGSPPLAQAEVVVGSGPDIFALVRHKVVTYLLCPEPADVLRFDPATGAVTPVPDGQRCGELGGIAFRRTADGLAVIDASGREWRSPDDLLRGLLGSGPPP